MARDSSEHRRQQNRAEARRRILDATEALLIEAGHEGFSIRKLVSRCGYTAPTIYHYFGDKPGLIDELLEERLAQLVEDLNQVPMGRDLIENFRALCHAFARFGLDNPTHYQLLTQPRDKNMPPPPSGEEARRLMESPLDELASAGWIDDAKLTAARQSIWAHLHGLISLRASRPDIEWEEDVLDRTLEAIVRGWLNRPTQEAADGAARLQPVRDEAETEAK